MADTILVKIDSETDFFQVVGFVGDGIKPYIVYIKDNKFQTAPVTMCTIVDTEKENEKEASFHDFKDQLEAELDDIVEDSKIFNFRTAKSLSSVLTADHVDKIHDYILDELSLHVDIDDVVDMMRNVSFNEFVNSLYSRL